MPSSFTNNQEFEILHDLDMEEQLLLNECMTKMIGHLERNIEKPAKNHKQVSKLLSYRYLFQKNLRTIEN
ncbi:MAG: hypothetical protein ACI9A7_002513 [Cyclobacteriaceae bacterium]|jgi:hypothetical protein